MSDSIFLFGIPIAICIAISLLARADIKKRKKWKSTLSILASDYTFENYATISTASLLYAILQGGLFGTSFGFVALSFIEKDWQYAGYSLLCLLMIVNVRLIIEGYIALYKTARDASMYFTLSSRQMLLQNPLLQDSYGEDFNPILNTKPSRGSSSKSRGLFDLILISLEENNIDATNASFEQSYLGKNSATLFNNDGTILAEIEIDTNDSTLYLLLDRGDKMKLTTLPTLDSTGD